MENFHHFDNNESQLAPGYRFHPTDEELITYYLVKKVLDSNFMARAIAEVDLNKCEPWELPGKAKMGEKEWYFFSLRDRKYPTGLRTNRATEAGYWKATGKDREIYGSRTGSLLGMKKTLVFYKGRAPKGEKTNWVMHEYRLEGKFSYLYLSTTSKHEWVISRVFHKSGGGGSGKKSRATGSVYMEIGSPSSTSLPPLFESSLFAGMTDQESCSCESDNTREHVPCFSTATAAASANFSLHPFVPPSIIANPMARFGNSRASAFPSLQSLQEKLQQPFISAVEPPMTSSPLGFEQQNQMGGCSSAGNFREPEQVVARRNRQQLQMGAVELDCLWTC